VPVCGQLYEILDEHLLRLDWSAGFVFGRTATTPYSYSGVRKRTESAYTEAKLQPSDLQLHECRHSFSSWLAAAGSRSSVGTSTAGTPTSPWTPATPTSWTTSTSTTRKH
jgi:integrase